MRYVLIIFALGCGDGVQQTEPAPCDPLANTGCANGESCRAVVDGSAICLTPQDPGDESCVTGSCAVGETCLRVEGRLACHALCRPDTDDCVAGACAYQLAASADALGVCTQPCELGEACGPGGTCGFGADPRALACVGVGPAAVGESCVQDRCAAGSVCLAESDANADGLPRCAALCEPNDVNACQGGGCRGAIEGFVRVGYCR